MSTLNGNSWGRCLIEVLTLRGGICPLNSRIKWLLWHVQVHFDCAGSHKVISNIIKHWNTHTLGVTYCLFLTVFAFLLPRWGRSYGVTAYKSIQCTETPVAVVAPMSNLILFQSYCCILLLVSATLVSYPTLLGVSCRYNLGYQPTHFPIKMSAASSSYHRCCNNPPAGRPDWKQHCCSVCLRFGMRPKRHKCCDGWAWGSSLRFSQLRSTPTSHVAKQEWRNQPWSMTKAWGYPTRQKTMSSKSSWRLSRQAAPLFFLQEVAGQNYPDQPAAQKRSYLWLTKPWISTVGSQGLLSLCWRRHSLVGTS